jgi:mono/diheme cytochrome c family protein
VSASHSNRKFGLELLEKTDPNDVNATYNDTFKYAREVLNRKPAESDLKERNVAAPPHLDKAFAQSYIQGSEIYSREGHCITCHQGNGKGLPGSGFPPLSGTKWVTGNTDRLIKLTLKGLMGPIEVMGVQYPGQVPMTPFEHMLKDDEISAVLTYVRNSFGNKASPVTIDQVAKIRNNFIDKLGLYSPEQLLKEHPLEKN